MFSFRNRYEEMESYRKKTNFVRFIEGFIIGNLIGVLIGLLLAPKSGKQTAIEISNGAKKWIKQGKESIPSVDISKIKFGRKSFQEEKLLDFEQEEI